MSHNETGKAMDYNLKLIYYADLLQAICKYKDVEISVAKRVVAVIVDEYKFESIITFKHQSRLVIKCTRLQDNTIVALKFCDQLEVECELTVLEAVGGKH